jgi:hypothetical protein
MWLDNPVRWGGLAALVAGALLTISALLRLYIDLGNPAVLGAILLVDGWLGVFLAVLVQLGLVGLYAPQARATGILGLVGFVLGSAGIQLTMGASFVFAFSRPVVWPWEDPEYFERTIGALAIFGLSFVLGWVLLGIAALRARAYPRVAAMLLVAGSLILLIPLPLSDLIFAGSVAWLGYALYEEGGAPVEPQAS